MVKKEAAFQDVTVLVAQVEGETSWWIFRPRDTLADDWRSCTGHWYYPAEEFDVALVQAKVPALASGDRVFVRRERGTITRDGVFRAGVKMRHLVRDRDVEHCAILDAADVEAAQEDYEAALRVTREYDAKQQEIAKELSQRHAATKAAENAKLAIEPQAVASTVQDGNVGVDGIFILAASRVPCLSPTDPFVLALCRFAGADAHVFVEIARDTRLLSRTAAEMDAKSSTAFRLLGHEVAPESVSELTSPFHDEHSLLALASSEVGSFPLASQVKKPPMVQRFRRREQKLSDLARPLNAAVPQSGALPDAPKPKAHRSEAAPAPAVPQQDPIGTSKARCCGLLCWTPVLTDEKQFQPGEVVSDPVAANAVSCMERGVFVTGTGDAQPTEDAASAGEAVAPTPDYLKDLLDCVELTK